MFKKQQRGQCGWNQDGERGVWGGDVGEITGSPDRGVDPATDSIIGLGVYPAGGSELGC